MNPAPPRLLRWLLCLALPPGPVRDGLLGDLDELFSERARKGRMSALFWYTRQAISASVRYLPQRLFAGRSSRAGPWMMEGLMNDLGYAIRTSRRRPGFTAVVVTTLALGIGATTAIFSVVDAVLFRPLPYPEADRLVRVLQHHRDDRDVTVGAVSREEFVDMQGQSGSVYAALAAYATGTRVLTGALGDPDELSVAYVSPGFFSALGVPTAIGRTLAPDEGLPGGDRVAILSDRIWRSRFGSDPEIIDSTIRLDGTTFTILGVMPASFDFPSPETDAFLPLSVVGCDDIPCDRSSRFLLVVGRLAPAATISTASVAAGALFERLEESYPEASRDRTATVIPLRESQVGDVRPQLLILLGAVGFLLLITCANVANLLVARGLGRGREFAVRAALGAGRARVMRQVLTEGLLLAAVGGALGFLLAIRGVDLLVALAGESIPRTYAIHPDFRIAAFAFLTSLFTGTLFGLLPAIAAGRVNVHEGLKASGRTGSGGASSPVGRGVLIGVETALAVILVTGATLLVKSFWNLTQVDTGFASESVLALSIRTDGDVMSGEERNRYRRELVQRVQAVPGVLAAGWAKDVPLHGVTESYSFTLPDRLDGPVIRPQTLIVTGGYFETMGIPLRAGRPFVFSDEIDQLPVVIVNETLARQHWPDGGAVGETVHLLGRLPVEIVGVVGDVRHGGIRQPPKPTMYVLPHFGGRAGMNLFVRTSSAPLAMADAVRRAIWEVNPDQPIRVSTMDQVVSGTVAQPRFLTVLLGGFAGTAMVLAMLGVYGVTVFEVGRRTYDIGVRMALGARTPDVLRLIFRQGALPMLGGIGVGILVARVLASILSAALYGVEATDALTFATVPIVLSALGLLSIYMPARRATRVDPKVALRAE